MNCDDCCCSKCICLRQDYDMFDESYFWCADSGEIIEDPDYSPVGYCSGYMEK